MGKKIHSHGSTELGNGTPEEGKAYDYKIYTLALPMHDMLTVHNVSVLGKCNKVPTKVNNSTESD